MKCTIKIKNKKEQEERNVNKWTFAGNMIRGLKGEGAVGFQGSPLVLEKKSRGRKDKKLYFVAFIKDYFVMMIFFL